MRTKHGHGMYIYIWLEVHRRLKEKPLLIASVLYPMNIIIFDHSNNVSLREHQGLQASPSHNISHNPMAVIYPASSAG